MVDSTKCMLCKRQFNDIIIGFDNKFDFKKDRFDDRICYICNCHYQLTGNFKAVNDYDLKKISFIILTMNRIKDYYEDEKRIQQSEYISKWKNDKYLKQWYEKKFGGELQFKYFKLMLDRYFDNFGEFINNGELKVKFKGEKHFVQWLNKNYYGLKNEIKWH